MAFADNANFSTEKAEWIKITEVSDSGTVLEADVCGVKLTGMEVRNLFSLRSPVFSVEYADGEYVFTVSGYGHGVGLSQNGANCMAENGSTYEEIISHYYKDVTITDREAIKKLYQNVADTTFSLPFFFHFFFDS